MEQSLENVVELFGLHATCASVAKRITESGTFAPSTKGRLGRGVYFWRDNPLVEDLAFGWYEYQKSVGTYRGQSDMSPTVISCCFTVEEPCFLDLTDPETRDGLNAFYLKYSKPTKEDDQISSFYDIFIRWFEKKIGKKVKVLLAPVTAPPERFCGRYNVQALGYPNSYVVKEPACIRIIDQKTSPTGG